MSDNQVSDFSDFPLSQGFSTNLQKEIEDARFTRPQFPPKITSKDLIVHKKNGDMPSRPPNAFMIYRKLFVDELHNDGHYLPMTSASSMASSSWKKEPDFVKQEYRRLASEAKSRHLKLYSQIPCKKRNRKIRNVNHHLQIIPQYSLSQSRSEGSTAVSSPITSSPEISLTEEISRVSHNIPYGLNNNEPVGFYLPHTHHQFPVEFNARNNFSSGTSSGFGPFQDHSNMVLYENLIADYHQFGSYQESISPQTSIPQNFLQSTYPYFY